MQSKQQIKDLLEAAIDEVKKTPASDPMLGLMTILCANLSTITMTLIDIRDILNENDLAILATGSKKPGQNVH